MSQRYFIEIAYHGKNYIGWQVQPTGISVQAKINEALSLFLREPINVVGCGRTDTGVHASSFFLHFDAENPLPDDLLNRLNRYLPPDIAAKRIIIQIPANAHARFDATYRAYDYYIHFNKNPFLTEFSFFFPWRPLNLEVMQQAIELLPQYFAKPAPAPKPPFVTSTKPKCTLMKPTKPCGSIWLQTGFCAAWCAAL